MNGMSPRRRRDWEMRTQGLALAVIIFAVGYALSYGVTSIFGG